MAVPNLMAIQILQGGSTNTQTANMAKLSLHFFYYDAVYQVKCYNLTI